MKKYNWILFDADDTLFHFDAFSGLQLMFKKFDVDFNLTHYNEYQLVNKQLWVDYQNHLITATQLQCKRFDAWAAKLNVSSHDLNSGFLSAMADICKPLDGAVDLLHALSGKVKMGIITNGFTSLQQTRLERTGLSNHFELLVISEQVGVAKPHIDIFDHALHAMGNPSKESVLMVGDTLESDIIGGINAGLDTCWINHHDRKLPENISPVYQVTSLIELKDRLLSVY